MTSTTIKFAEALKQGSTAVWNLPDNDYKGVRILKVRDKFKSGTEAISTTLGIVSISAFFQFATQDVKKKHLNPADGTFQFDSNVSFDITLYKGNVMTIAFSTATVAAPLAAAPVLEEVL